MSLISGLLVPYTDYIQDSRGRPIVNVNVAVLLSVAPVVSFIGGNPVITPTPANTSTQPGTVLANVYADEAGTIPLTNPLTLGNGIDSLGNILFYAAAGSYVLQYYGGALSQQFVVNDVIIGNPTGATAGWSNVFTTSTVNADFGSASTVEIGLAGGNVASSTFVNPTPQSIYTVIINQITGNCGFTWPNNVVGAGNISVYDNNVSANTYSTQKFYYNQNGNIFYAISPLVTVSGSTGQIVT